jgi:hypothetical protein
MEKEVKTRESIPIHLKGWLILIYQQPNPIDQPFIHPNNAIDRIGRLASLGHQPTCTSKENVTGTSQDLAIPTSLQQGLAIVGFFGESSHLFLLFLVLGAGSRLFHTSECRRKYPRRDLVVEGGQAPEGVGVGFLGVRVFGDLI